MISKFSIVISIVYLLSQCTCTVEICSVNVFVQLSLDLIQCDLSNFSSVHQYEANSF
jgi:hypothetical protein